MKKRFLFLTVLLVLLALLIPTALAADTAVSGAISVLKPLSSEPARAGKDIQYKVTVKKAGTLMAVLTNRTTGEKKAVMKKTAGGAGSCLLVVPGNMIADETVYTLALALRQGSTTIGTASTTISTRKPAAQINSFAVTPSFNPVIGGWLACSFDMPDNAYVTAYVTDSSGNQIATVLDRAAKHAGLVTFDWNGVLTSGGYVPDGLYTVHCFCVNAGGTSPTASASFRVTGTKAGSIPARTAGTIKAGQLTEPVRQGQSALIVINSTVEGSYRGKMKDTVTGKLLELRGRFIAGRNSLTLPATACTAGHGYILQLIQYSGSKQVGKLQLEFTAVIDAPTISMISIPSEVRAGCGAAVTISYTLGAPGTVKVSVQNAEGEDLLVLSTGAKNAGTQNLYWSGRNAQKEYLPDSAYNLCVTCTNSAGTASRRIAFVYKGAVSDAMIPKTTGTVNLFACTQSCPAAYTELSFLLRATETGTLKLYAKRLGETGNGRLIYSSAVVKGLNRFRLRAGYFGARDYQLTAYVYKGSKLTGAGICYVEAKDVAPAVTDLKVPDKITNDWVDVAACDVTLATPGNLTVQVLDGSGTVKRTIISGKAVTGTTRCSWDGRYDSGWRTDGGTYTVRAFYTDHNGKVSPNADTKITVCDPAYPSGVYGYTYVGCGTYKTKINLYKTPGGTAGAFTYGQGAAFTILEDLGTYCKVRCSGMTGTPLTCYVLSSSIEKIPITSPYHIEVCIDRTGDKAQTMWIYRGAELIDTFKVSTGMEKGSTPTGDFIVCGRMPYFYNSGAMCRYALRLVGGICLHSVPYEDGTPDAATKLLGQVASHGCVRSSVEKSRWIYDNIPDSTPVRIFSTGK